MHYYHIPHATILKVTGKDSPRYLQSRLTNNIKLLTVGKRCFAAQLTPQGKTQGILSVFRADETCFILTCDQGNREDIIAAFKKYIVADRVIVEDCSVEGALFCVDASLTLPDSADLYRTGERFASYSDVVALSGNATSALREHLTTLHATTMSAAAFELLEFQAGIPRFGKELDEQTLFSESGFDDAIAANKGCYVGQEVVEKIESFGKAPKIFKRVAIMHTVTGHNNLEPGTPVMYGDTDIGRVISVCPDANADRSLAFIRIKNDASIDLNKLLISGNTVQSYEQNT